MSPSHLKTQDVLGLAAEGKYCADEFHLTLQQNWARGTRSHLVESINPQSLHN